LTAAVQSLVKEYLARYRLSSEKGVSMETMENPLDPPLSPLTTPASTPPFVFGNTNNISCHTL
jgi:hypothetical protein